MMSGFICNLLNTETVKPRARFTFYTDRASTHICYGKIQQLLVNFARGAGVSSGPLPQVASLLARPPPRSTRNYPTTDFPNSKWRRSRFSQLGLTASQGCAPAAAWSIASTGCGTKQKG